jgi:uroporphyrinogen decarboxylase
MTRVFALIQLKNDRLLKAIRREPLDRTPVWIMRQAGRYLPEYQATRKAAGSFMRLCQTPELACEVTLQPLLRFDLDAAIIFSDILTIPDAMGLGLHFVEGTGPVFTHPLRQLADIKRLSVPPTERLQYVYEAIKLVQYELSGKLPLIGFCGSPWTLALYMIDGHARSQFQLALRLRQESPDLFHILLNTLAKSVAAHLHFQVEAGVQIIMLFDSWGGLLCTPQDYESFSLNYIKQIIAEFKLYDNYTNSRVPIILFTKGGAPWLEQMAETGCDVVGVDWEISLKEARRRIGAKVTLQGNMNPSCLLNKEVDIRQEVSNILASFGQGRGHIFNLGHGITPDVPPEHVQILVEAVHELSRPYHR